MQQPHRVGFVPLRFSLFAAGMLLTQPALAQMNSAQSSALEEVVVIANRIPLPLRRIGSSVSVLDAEDIAAHGNLALSDVLRQQPGIASSSNGGMGQPLSVRIRGEEGFRTLTLLDGLRVSDPSATQVGPLLEHLLSSGIERVEILRGPQGLGYGADAGGVLNISSRAAGEGLQATLDAQGGSFDTQQYSGSLSAGNERADVFVGATQLQSAGFNTLTADTAFADRDGYANDTLHLRGGINVTESWRAELVHRHVDGSSDYDNCFSVTGAGNDCRADYLQRASRLALHYADSSGSHTLSWNRTDTDRDNFSSDAFAFGSQGELQRWEYTGSATALPGFDLVFGADLEEALNNGVGRHNRGVFVEYLSDFSSSVYLSAGLRHDDNDDFGSNTSHRVSAAYVLDLPDARTLRFKGSIGSGFRAPSPYEIQYNSGPWAYPPASLVRLQQESSRGWEAGVEFTQGTLQLDAVYFDQQVEDAITFDLVSWSGYLQDFGSSRSRGVELGAALLLDEHWQLRSNYTWNDTARPNGLQRLRRPRQLFNAGLTWTGLDQQRLQLNAFVRAAQDSIDEVAGTVVDLPDFAVLDLGAALHISPALQLYGRLENALDEQYQEVAGYRTAGRAAYVGFRFGISGP